MSRKDRPAAFWSCTSAALCFLVEALIRPFPRGDVGSSLLGGRGSACFKYFFTREFSSAGTTKMGGGRVKVG